MDNALKNTKFLNFIRKNDVPFADCKFSSSNNSPQIRQKHKHNLISSEQSFLEQRVLAWFFQKGIRRGDPCLLLDSYKQVQLKKIASERENLKPQDLSLRATEKKENSLLNRRLKRRLTVQL